MQVTLTKAQARALRSLADLTKTNPRPSLQEWAEVAGKDGRGLTMAALMPHRNILMAFGLIAKEPGKTRSTHVTTAGRRYLKEQA